jgi:hypothetical protein
VPDPPGRTGRRRNAAAVLILGYDSVIELTTRHAGSFYADPVDRDRLVERLARTEFLDLSDAEATGLRAPSRGLPHLL